LFFCFVFKVEHGREAVFKPYRRLATAT
jgi:hypothetical protein